MVPGMLIGFSGRLRSGKDTAAAPLIAAGWHHASFARALKAFTYALNPIVPLTHGGYGRLSLVIDAVGWEAAKDDYPEVRALLQRCGTEAGRAVLGDDVWVRAALDRLPEGDVVFTDVRFTNEADAIRAAGGVVVRVDRPSLPAPGPDTHPSETALDGYDFDHTVVNDSTIPDLHSAIAKFIEARTRR